MIRLLVCLLLSYPISIEFYWVYLSLRNPYNIIQWFGLSGGDVKYSVLGHDWGRNLCKCVWRLSSHIERFFVAGWALKSNRERFESSFALTETRNGFYFRTFCFLNLIFSFWDIDSTVGKKYDLVFPRSSISSREKIDRNRISFTKLWE